MRGLPFVLMALSVATPAAADVSYFRSDQIGVPLQPLPWFRVDEYEWVLEVSTGAVTDGIAVSIDAEIPSAAATVEIQRLLRATEEERRWELARTAEGVVVLEREIVAGALVADRRFDSRGLVVEEREFVAGRLETVRSVVQAGPVREMEIRDGAGRLLATDRVLQSRAGRILGLVRILPDGTRQETRYGYGGGRLLEEVRTTGHQMELTRFTESGQQALTREWQGVTEIRSLRTTYSDGRRTHQVEEDLASGAMFERDFDDAGRLVTERERGRNQVLTDYAWNPDDTRAAVRRQGPDGVEEWRYEYADGKLTGETYRLRGALVSRIDYQDQDRRIESLYRNGDVFLRVLYDGDRRIQEEFIRAGEVIRTRNLAAS